MIKRRITMKIQLKICLRIILCVWFVQVLHDVAAGMSPTSQKISDANLMFEFLLAGVELDRDNNVVLLEKEMASMRQGRAFLSQINDDIPRGRSSMVQMADTLEGQRGKPLTQGQFDVLVLGMVYSAHQARHQEREEDQEAWGRVLLQLANVTVHQLRGSYLFSYE